MPRKPVFYKLSFSPGLDEGFAPTPEFKLCARLLLLGSRICGLSGSLKVRFSTSIAGLAISQFPTDSRLSWDLRPANIGAPHLQAAVYYCKARRIMQAQATTNTFLMHT